MTSLSVSKIPFFGRAYTLTITPQQGPSAGTPIVISSDSFEPSALRFTFEIIQYAFSAFWQAEIAIWNADGPISVGPSAGINLYDAIIQEGDIVTVSAGYQADYPFPGTPPIIWSGPIFYTIQDRLDVVDKRLIVHCLLNRVLSTQNFLNGTIPALSTQFSQAKFIADNAMSPVRINESQVKEAISSAFPQRGSANLPRGKSFFGNPIGYLRSIADQNSLASWIDSKGWSVASFQNPLGELVATYAPVNTDGGPPNRVGKTTLSLIGQPQQTQLGVNFRVLLDPTVQVKAPLPLVAVQSKFIRQAPIPYPLPEGTGPPVPLIDQYAVVGVRFIGDTRGNAWYSEITGIAQIQQAIQLLGQSLQADATGN
jgi:hypothetical protein